MRLKTIRSCASRLHGLTYGEMMIVLVVFSILAIMFVISSKFAVVKARHSAALQMLKTIRC